MISNDELIQYLDSFHYETVEIMGMAVEQTPFKQIQNESVILSWIFSQMPVLHLGEYEYKKHSGFLQRTGPRVKLERKVSEWQ